MQQNAAECSTVKNEIGLFFVRLTHSKPTMLYQHYAGRATQAEAEGYFAILPPVK